jgi:ABC-type Fe3+/spermidine/putrescine transport system ATPase subunit
MGDGEQRVAYSIEGLAVSLGGTRILNNIDLSIQQGSFTSLLGPSGSGKSTLLKTLAGLIAPSAGRVLHGSEDITGQAPEKRAMVIVFQDLRLFPHMDVASNVGFGLKMRGVSRAQRASVVDEMLARVQLEGMGSRRVSQLSGGQQQRVCLARALAAKPDLLLLDEPFSSLDEQLRQQMRALVRELHESMGLTTLLVTHDQAEALMLSDVIAILFEGALVQTGSPRELYECPATTQVADYLGEANYLPGRVEAGRFWSEVAGIELALDGLCTPLRAEELVSGDGYLLMVRPERVSEQLAGDEHRAEHRAEEHRATGSLEGVVQSVDYQGSRNCIRLQARTGETTLSLRLPADRPINVGDGLAVTLDLSQAVLYRAGQRDAEQGQV